MSDPVDSDRNREHDLEPEWDPSVHRLPVWATIREAVQAIAKEWKALLKAIAVPALGLAAVAVVTDREYLEGVFPSPPGYPGVLLPLFLPALLSAPFATMISVSCHRLVILGVDSLPSAWGLFWSRRETRFLGWSALIAIPVGVVPILSAVLGSPLLMFLVLVPYSLYLVPRLSLVLPATAIGQRPTLKGSWRLSESNAGPLLLVMLLPSLLLGLLYRVGSLLLDGTAPQFLSAFIGVLVAVLSWVIGIAALSKAFCWFTGEIEAKSPS